MQGPAPRSRTGTQMSMYERWTQARGAVIADLPPGTSRRPASVSFREDTSRRETVWDLRGGPDYKIVKNLCTLLRSIFTTARHIPVHAWRFRVSRSLRHDPVSMATGLVLFPNRCCFLFAPGQWSGAFFARPGELRRRSPGSAITCSRAPEKAWPSRPVDVPSASRRGRFTVGVSNR